jgi:hypothetical protein
MGCSARSPSGGGASLSNRLALGFPSPSDELLHQLAAVLPQHLELREPRFHV